MTKRMGGLGKLSDFGRSTPEFPTSTTQPEAPETSQPEVEIVSLPAKSKEQKKLKKVEKPVTINIKIAREQQEWLADIARQVRDNNPDPVPASDRCYPQHLIQVAIDLLASAPVNWAEVRTPEELRKQLNL
ncbi:hypothetical protein [Leptolyngbya sp. NIES-2104]|uniref:hypothetical protein n=1 Tax=Leptolyngbya sp. NIES-2104 TaxID=1552121 RepID=UPI0006EC9622|nr:hypothetical protein [Leptolyngbya sp. NIES-2104]GAQ00204.1 hypothetical protein NIES2104_67690 [Leptolyngbya sp. NIES-2104]